MTRPARVSPLGEAIDRRRIDLGMRWRQVETAANLSYEGLRGIRRGDRNPSGLTARRLEAALRWKHGSIEAIIDGGEPTPAEPDGGEPLPDTDRLTDIADQLRALSEEIEKLKAERDGHAGHGESTRRAQ